MPRVSQVSQYGRPEYFAVRCLLFSANLTDVGLLRYVCLLFPDGKNIIALGRLVGAYFVFQLGQGPLL